MWQIGLMCLSWGDADGGYSQVDSAQSLLDARASRGSKGGLAALGQSGQMDKNGAQMSK